MTTQENLETAFGGESQACQKYAAFAKKAEKDGLKYCKIVSYDC